jgi:hypothetical protein
MPSRKNFKDTEGIRQLSAALQRLEAGREISRLGKDMKASTAEIDRRDFDRLMELLTEADEPEDMSGLLGAGRRFPETGHNMSVEDIRKLISEQNILEDVFRGIEDPQSVPKRMR